MNIRPPLRKAGTLALDITAALLHLSYMIFDAASRGLRAVTRSSLFRGPLRSLTRVGVLALLIATVILSAGWYAVERIPPGVIAVRQVNWGPGSGIVERDYGAGFAFAAGNRNTWHQLPARTHLVNFAWDSEGGTHPMLAVSLPRASPRRPSSATASIASPDGLFTCIPSNIGVSVPVISSRSRSKGTAHSAASRTKTIWPVGAYLAL